MRATGEAARQSTIGTWIDWRGKWEFVVDECNIGGNGRS
jgi:hypothetical protein